jgi:hypothetical protein
MKSVQEGGETRGERDYVQGFSGARDDEVVGEDQKLVGKRGIGTNGCPCR